MLGVNGRSAYEYYGGWNLLYNPGTVRWYATEADAALWCAVLSLEEIDALTADKEAGE
jgi:hypothetical protein